MDGIYLILVHVLPVCEKQVVHLFDALLLIRIVNEEHFRHIGELNAEIFFASS